jgi:hypothetical protein
MAKTYKTMQGREVDMDKLMAQNELMPAIGNVKVNARGDELGPGGKIIRKREDVMADYYENNPKAIPENKQPVKTKQPVIPEVGVGTNSKRTK